MIQDYVVAKTYDDLMALIAETHNPVVLAGGTDTFPLISKNERLLSVIDISGVPELVGITLQGGKIRIGAATKIVDLIRDEEIAAYAPAFQLAAKEIASPQIRNQATVVGNLLTKRAVANLLPLAAAVGGILEVTRESKKREIRLAECTNQIALKEKEIVLALVLPATVKTRTASYQNVKPRKGFAYSSVIVASAFSTIENKYADASIYASPVIPAVLTKELKPCISCAGNCRICHSVPIRQLSEVLEGEEATNKGIDDACEKVAWSQYRMRDSQLNGVGGYRQHLLHVLAQRGLHEVLRQYQ